MMFDLWQRLQREVKANRQKAGLLAGLLAFGCCFWVPMLARAVTPKKVAAATHATSTVPTAAHVANQLPTPTAPTPADQGKFWANLTKSLAEDSMFQSADVQTLARDPFQAEAPAVVPDVVVEKPQTQPEIKPTNDVASLELSSTIIGRARRAALINGQLYQLGRKIQANGRSYVVTRIESNRVELLAGEETLELTLARTQLNDVLERGSPDGSQPKAPLNQ